MNLETAISSAAPLEGGGGGRLQGRGETRAAGQGEAEPRHRIRTEGGKRDERGRM